MENRGQKDIIVKISGHENIVNSGALWPGDCLQESIPLYKKVIFCTRLRNSIHGYCDLGKESGGLDSAWFRKVRKLVRELDSEIVFDFEIINKILKLVIHKLFNQ